MTHESILFNILFSSGLLTIYIYTLNNDVYHTYRNKHRGSLYELLSTKKGTRKRFTEISMNDINKKQKMRRIAVIILNKYYTILDTLDAKYKKDNKIYETLINKIKTKKESIIAYIISLIQITQYMNTPLVNKKIRNMYDNLINDKIINDYEVPKVYRSQKIWTNILTRTHDMYEFKYEMPHIYITQKLCEEIVHGNAICFIDIPNKFKTKKMCEYFLSKYPADIHHVPDKYLTEKMYDTAFKHDFSLFSIIPDKYKTKKMCDTAFQINTLNFSYIPCQFITYEQIVDLITKGFLYKLKNYNIYYDLIINIIIRYQKELETTFNQLSTLFDNMQGFKLSHTQFNKLITQNNIHLFRLISKDDPSGLYFSTIDKMIFLEDDFIIDYSFKKFVALSENYKVEVMHNYIYCKKILLIIIE